MNAKVRRRIALGVAALAALVICGVLVSAALKDNMLYFYGPSQAKAQVAAGRAFRLGGLVVPGSVKRENGVLHFTVTDGKAEIPVAFRGLPPALFAEGAGVVAEGRLGPDGIFAADRILARHDARYMPPDVVQALKKTGHWCQGKPGENCR